MLLEKYISTSSLSSKKILSLTSKDFTPRILKLRKEDFAFTNVPHILFFLFFCQKSYECLSIFSNKIDAKIGQ